MVTILDTDSSQLTALLEVFPVVRHISCLYSATEQLHEVDHAQVLLFVRVY